MKQNQPHNEFKYTKLLTIFVTITTILTGALSPAIAHNQDAQSNCSNIISDPAADPYAEVEQAEALLTQLIAQISSMFNQNEANNRLVTEILDKLDKTRIKLGALQDELLANDTLNTEQFYSVLEYLEHINSNIKSGTDLAFIGSDMGIEPDTNKVNTISLHQIVLTKKAEKELANLQPQYRAKYSEFTNEIRMLANPLSLPRKWYLEKINVHPDTNGKPAYTVRLNVGYRVLFMIEPSGEILVLRISKTATHYN